MLDIAIISIGKMKDQNYSAAVAEYIKRLTPYAKIRTEELRAEPFRTESDRLPAKKSESDRLLAALSKHAEADIYVLDERGELFSSKVFAQKLGANQSRKKVFVIGGALGLSEELLSLGNSFALSRLTMPHELAKAVLLEQIYRAACINSGKQYHY